MEQPGELQRHEPHQQMGSAPPLCSAGVWYLLKRCAYFVRDWMLVLLLLFLLVLTASESGKYGTCDAELLPWQLVNFSTMLLFRLCYFLTHYFYNGTVPLFCASATRRRLPALLVAFKLWLLLPFQTAWVVLGIVLYARDRSCLPDQGVARAYLAWVALAALFVVQFAALVASVLREHVAHPRAGVQAGSRASWAAALGRLHVHVLERMQQKELQQLDALPDVVFSDEDLFGVEFTEQPLQMVHVDGTHTAGPAGMPPMPNGLSEAQIAALPLRELQPEERTSKLCSVCLIDFPQLPTIESTNGSSLDLEAAKTASTPTTGACTAGETASPEPAVVYSSAPVLVPALACPHVYHAECLARWLRDTAKCPNCRACIGPSLEERKAEHERAFMAARMQEERERVERSAQGVPSAVSVDASAAASPRISSSNALHPPHLPGTVLPWGESVVGACFPTAGSGSSPSPSPPSSSSSSPAPEEEEVLQRASNPPSSPSRSLRGSLQSPRPLSPRLAWQNEHEGTVAAAATVARLSL